MLSVKKHKNYTASGNIEAEKLLDSILNEIGTTLQSSGLSVYLGGSYGRGEGGVRLDRENGILYNDLDFFVFARKADKNAAKILHEIAEKYEVQLKVDIDFSRIMSIKDIKNNSKRLMMQELKRGYCLVCGEDLLAEYLPAITAEELPFSEACRLLLNRGMGLCFAEEKVASKSEDMDFILRNINKAILGAGDAILITKGKYLWRIDNRLEEINKLDLPEEWKKLYADAVAFKSSPNRNQVEDIVGFIKIVKDFFQASVLVAAEAESMEKINDAIWEKCSKNNELNILNYAKYCLKTRKLHRNIKFLQIPPAATVLCKLFDKNVCSEELYDQWLKFN